MKKIICILLSLCLLLSGCGHAEDHSVSFYYCRSPEDYQYFEADGVIRAEARDVTGHRSDLRYLVSLYLAGPLEERLQSPFPRTARLISVSIVEDTIQIQLSDQSKTMTDAEFSMACACLTLTCMGFLRCSQVTIISGDRTVSMNTDSILLSDDLLPQETTGG